MEDRFDQLEKRFDRLIQHLDDKFTSIDGRLALLASNIGDLTEITLAMKVYMEGVEMRMVTKDEFNEGLTQMEERLNSKIHGVQRSVDAAYERDGALEARVTKLELAK